MRPADSASASSITLIDDSMSHDRPFTHECARASRLTDQSARERHGGRFDRRKRRDRGGESSAAGAADEGGIEMVELAARVQSMEQELAALHP